MADNKFRQQLADVLDLWVTENLIESEQRDRLRQYYHLDDLSAAARGRFATVLLSMGGILIGLGIIVFIASNWAVIPPPARAIGALGLMIGLQGLGFYLWQSRRVSDRLATVSLFIGEMAMGASIGLMAQWFQVSGKSSGLFLAWSLGILAMAFGLRHAPTGALGIILWLIGFVSDQGGTPSGLYAPAIVPWVTALVLFPLAYWCRSRWIFVCSSLSWLAALETLGWHFLYVGNLEYEWNEILNAYVLTMPLLLGAIALWCWSFWHQRHLPWLQSRLESLQDSPQIAQSSQPPHRILPNRTPPDRRSSDRTPLGLDFGPVAQLLALLCLIALFYGWSFNYLWQVQFDRPLGALMNTLQLFWLEPRGTVISVWGVAIATLVLGVNGLWGQFHQRIQPDPTNPEPNGDLISSNFKTSQRLIGFSALSLLILIHSGAWWGLALLLTNLALFVLGAVITWQGLQLSQRWRFWLGLLTLVVHILTRFFEYSTGLLLKSLVLIICGVAVILAGLKFEQVRQT